MRKSKSLIFRDRLGLDEARTQFPGRPRSVWSCPMGWLEGINRRSSRAKPPTALPSADRDCCTKNLRFLQNRKNRVRIFWKIMKITFWYFRIIIYSIRYPWTLWGLGNISKTFLRMFLRSLRDRHNVMIVIDAKFDSDSRDIWKSRYVRLCVKSPTSPPALQSWF